MLKHELRKILIDQALDEVSFARRFRQGKTPNWATNEDLYYGRKINQEYARANVDLGQMSSFVHTILSKIDNPLTFKYTKRKQSQLKRVNFLNALKTFDAQMGDWDIKDIVGKKQAIIYGRTVYSYYADSIDGNYESHLENVDIYDFLIDPSAGGIDIDQAMYMGRFGVVKSREEIKKGVKSGLYLRTEAELLLLGDGNSTASSQEETNKINRTVDTNVWDSKKEIGNKDKFKFWEWYTTYEGERYYLLLCEDGATAIRVEKLADIFPVNKKIGDAMFPFWTWAAFPDLTEFWTPSFCDYVREVIMAQAVSINQMLDNAEMINKPQKIVNINAIENMNELKYRRDGIIKVKNNFNADQAYQTVKTPSISTPIEVFNILDAIREKASGVTAGAQGVADEDKVGIYEGNQANAADRFGFLNKSYAFGYKRLAKLYELGVRDNLIKKVAVDILGPDGVEIEEISRRDIFRKGDEFGVMVESSNAETALSEVDKRTKLTFLQSQGQNPLQNQQKAYEIQAGIAGFDDDTIRQLQDTSDFGTASVMSEAERDIEMILDGEKIKPNQIANTAYKQRFVSYLRDNQENISMEDFISLSNYILLLDPIIMRNMNQQANTMLMKQEMDRLKQPVDNTVNNPGDNPVDNLIPVV